MIRPQKKPQTKTYSQRLAARIRSLREQAGLSVDKVAERMTRGGYFCASHTLYHWENGTRKPQLDALPALAKALKLKKVGEIFPAK